MSDSYYDTPPDVDSGPKWPGPTWGDGSGLVDKNGLPLASALGFRGIRPDLTKVFDLVRDEVNRREARRIADDIERASSAPAVSDLIITLDELAALPAPEPLIEGWLYRDASARIVGPAGSYKSFIALDMACRIAIGGMPWHGLPVQQADVLYSVGEGLADYNQRIESWCEHNNVARSHLACHLRLTKCAVQIGSPAWDVMTGWVIDSKSGLLVIDTQAKATVDYEENSNSDGARVFAYLDQLRQDSKGCALLLVHHTGHANGDAANRGRGASSWRGAVDSELLVMSGDKHRATIRNDRQKFVDCGQDVEVHMVSVAGSLVATPAPPRDDGGFSEPAGQRKRSRDLIARTEVVSAVLRKRKADGLPGASFNLLAKTVGGKEALTKAAVECLIDDKRVVVEDGPNRSRLHSWAAEVLPDGSGDSPFQTPPAPSGSIENGPNRDQL